MAMKKKPVTGMKDILPKEMEIRDYVIGMIKETYKTFGFTSVETPCVEHIENLSSKQGGENEKLIFKIMKRGEKFNLETAKEELDLVDGGLRYDLTVPLSRYYSNNAAELPSPFKALQMGNVWRADRPQRGRYRQFMQCDIDILGEPTILAEIELILATTTLLAYWAGNWKKEENYTLPKTAKSYDIYTPPYRGCEDWFSYVKSDGSKEIKMQLDHLITNCKAENSSYDWSFIKESNGYVAVDKFSHNKPVGLPDHAIFRVNIDI